MKNILSKLKKNLIIIILIAIELAIYVMRDTEDFEMFFMIWIIIYLALLLFDLFDVEDRNVLSGLGTNDIGRYFAASNIDAHRANETNKRKSRSNTIRRFYLLLLLMNLILYILIARQ